MSTLAIEVRAARAQDVTTSQDALAVELADGRTITVPLAWYPRLLHGSVKRQLGLPVSDN